MSELFEAIMVICFGISWPTSIVVSWKKRTAKGKSLLFLIFIFIGYVFGMLSKILSGNLTYVFVFYVINIVMVLIEIALYFRNRHLDEEREKTGKER